MVEAWCSQVRAGVTKRSMLMCWRCAGIPELVRALQRRGQHVFLVSGGFRVIINPIAEMLGIPLDNVYANTILHQVSPHHWSSAAGLCAHGIPGALSRCERWDGGLRCTVSHISDAMSLT